MFRVGRSSEVLSYNSAPEGRPGLALAILGSMTMDFDFTMKKEEIT